MDSYQKATLSESAPRNTDPKVVESLDAAKWEKWFQPGADSGNSLKHYEDALKRCKDVNRDLQLGTFDIKKQKLSALILQSSPIRIVRPVNFTAEKVRDYVEKEQKRIASEEDSKEPWVKALSDLGYMISDVVTKLKPIIDIFMPQSLEYTMPYGCLMVIFEGAAKKKEKKDAAHALLKSLSKDLPIFDFYQVLFPTDAMKTSVAMLYIQILDLLYRLAKYFALGSLAKLFDALFPRDQYTLSEYSTNIKHTAAELEKFCEVGHMSETRTIRKTVENTDLALKGFTSDVQASMRSNAYELENLRQIVQKLENDQKMTGKAIAIHHVSVLFEVWDSQIGAVEDELQLWETPRFFTDPRDHWSNNGILPCIVKWTELPFNSILWVSSDSSGRQAWMTQFSLDLLRVVRAQSSQGQMVTFALCDRPSGVRWTPEILMKQLISQLLHLNPALAIEDPDLFNKRAFQRASNFTSTFQLLKSLIARLEPLLIIVDRIDLCRRDPNITEDQDIAKALSSLTKAFPTLKTIVTSMGNADSPELSGLGISIAIIKTRRRPHRRYDAAPRRPSAPPPPQALQIVRRR